MEQNKNGYDAIICDLGNVLVNFDHRISTKKISLHTHKSETEVYNLFFDSPLTGLYEEGKLTPDEFFQRVKDFLKLDMDSTSFFSIWNDIFFEVPINLKMQEFLRRVKKRYKLVMVSNLNVTHFEFLQKKVPIFDEFDKLILSYEVGFRKPAPEIYNAALSSVGTLAQKAFYIDDRRDLVEKAAGLGIRGIVFDGDGAFERIVRVFNPGIENRLDQ